MTPALTPAPLRHAAPLVDDGYRLVFQNNPSPMWVFSLDTHRFLAVNTAAVTEYGYPPDEFLALTIHDVYHNPAVGSCDGRGGDAKDLSTGSWVHRRRDGTTLQVEIRSSELTFEGRRARLIHVTNVTDRLDAEAARAEAETARRDSERLLAAIVESSHDAILSKTPDGVILTWNDAAERMYGFTATEAIGASINLIVPPDAQQQLADTLRTAGGGTRIASYETQRVHKDGHRLWVSSTISPISNRSGVVVALSTIARDITERKRLEEQIRQAQRMEALGSLAGGIAHDFNNLLTVILGMTELASAQLDPASPSQTDLDEIRMAGYSATLLTRQLLTFTRKGIVQYAVVDLNDTVTALDKILRRTLGEDVQFIVRQTPALWCVRADPGQLEQVLMNLVVNARDAMPDGGTLSVDTMNIECDVAFVAAHAGSAVGSFVRLSVTDTGCGIPSAALAHIFEPFFTTKGPSKGTGLGLSTVSGIVKEAGGFLAVVSEPGAGATFNVYFPRSADELPLFSPHGLPPAGTGTETILLVEDDHHVRALNARSLRGRGYTVLPARNADNATKMAERYKSKIDLLLTDIVMPGVNGQVLAGRLLKATPSLRVLYTSGYTDSIATLQTIRASAANLIQKPYSPDALARKVRSVLDGPHL